MKRPWFQYHLSTAIVLMFVAGGLIGLNVHTKQMPSESILDVFDIHRAVRCAPGWPLPFTELERRQIDAFAVNSGENVNVLVNLALQRDPRPLRSHVCFAPLAVDIAVALAILAAFAFVCEWLIRRRAVACPERAKDNSQGQAAAGGAAPGPPPPRDS